jgi:hypothetical protein
VPTYAPTFAPTFKKYYNENKNFVYLAFVFVVIPFFIIFIYKNSIRGNQTVISGDSECLSNVSSLSNEDIENNVDKDDFYEPSIYDEYL